jgi:uncharacterized repeat protein (TIGR01451 family)
LAVVALLLGLTLPFWPNASALTLFEANTVNDPGPSDSEIWSGQSIAQSFNATETYTLWTTRLLVLDSKKADSLTVTIHPDGGGYPNENITLATNSSRPPSTGSWYWVDFNFAAKPLLTRGNAYWIVAKSSQGFTNGYRWDRSNSNAFPGGTAAFQVSGGPWSRFDDDQLFQNFGVASSALLELGMTVNATTAEPGDQLRYVLYYNNTGGSTAERVWVNATLPTGISFVSSNPAPSSFGSGTYRWSFSMVAPGDYNIVVDAAIQTSVVDGTSLVTATSLEYTNETGVKGPARQAFTSTLVRAPDFIFSKSSNASSATPGGNLTFYLRLSNLGSRAAARVEVDDFLPAGFSLAANTAEDNRTGPAQWTFFNVQPGSLEVQLQIAIDYDAPGPTSINSANMRSYNSRGQLLQDIWDSTSVVLGVPPPPQVVASLTFSKPRVAQGERFQLFLSLRNLGPTTADWMWLNVSLPAEVEYLGATATPSSTSPGVVRWYWENVVVGNYSLAITLEVGKEVAVSRLLAGVEVAFSDSTGRPAGVVSSFATVDVALGPLGIEYLIWGFLGGLVAVVGFVLVRRGALPWLMRRRATFDEIFLLHRSGLLIRHYSRSIRADVDSDVIAGMLVAVQEFVKDSFRGEGLKELRVGRHSLLLAQGSSAVLAAAISGKRPEKLVPQLWAALADMEATYGQGLANWSGVAEGLPGLDDIIKRLLAGKYKRQRKRDLYLDLEGGAGPPGQIRHRR